MPPSVPDRRDKPGVYARTNCHLDGKGKGILDGLIGQTKTAIAYVLKVLTTQYQCATDQCRSGAASKIPAYYDRIIQGNCR